MYKTWGSHFSYSDIKRMEFKCPDWIRGTKVLGQTFNCEVYWKTIKPRSYKIADLAIVFFYFNVFIYLQQQQ